MKRKQAEYPFDNYWLYVVFHKKEKRNQANLIAKDGTHRTTIAYARYLMSVKEKRFLTNNEEVDHIDNNKQNDSISNLQILTRVENKQKRVEFYRKLNPLTVKLSCSNCKKIFEKSSKQYRFLFKKGQINFYCSKSCSHKKQIPGT